MEKQQMLDSVKRYLFEFSSIKQRERKILNARFIIDRKEFVSEDNLSSAYLDTSLLIEKNQTISQPSTVARMLQLLELNENNSILEIGTGSGWNTALLGFICNKGSVLSLEVYDELIKKARKRIEKFNLNNIKIKNTDFRNLKEKFDKIIFTAGIENQQEKIIEDFVFNHLNNNGILICPFQSGPLIIIKKTKNKIEKYYTKDEYRFVPLIL